VVFDPKHNRVRCLGHIINLSLQAFLLANSKEALNAALLAADDVTIVDPIARFSASLASESTSGPVPVPEPAELSEQSRRRRNYERIPAITAYADGTYSGWQGISSLRKLHNIAVWLRKSSLHDDKWRDTVGIQLGIDNATRWNSWYTLLEKTIRKKAQINQFFLIFGDDLGDDVLDDDDWQLLTSTHRFLQVFQKATLKAEGDGASIADTLRLMDLLLKHYEQARVVDQPPDSFTCLLSLENVCI
jgi:hypothetical protein